MSYAWCATACIAITVAAILFIKLSPFYGMVTVIATAFTLAWTGYADIHKDKK